MTFPYTEINFLQLVVGIYGQAVRFGDDFRRAAGPLQRAAVYAAEGDVLQKAAQALRLLDAAGVERHVRRALIPLLHIAVRFAVAHYI